MSKLEFISSIINSIAWPIVVLTISILLRKPIVKILYNLTKVTFNNIEMDFEQKLDQLESNLEDKGLTENIDYPVNKRDKEITTIAQISPTASITMAWSMIEQEINSTMDKLGEGSSNPTHNIRYLKENNLIGLDTEQALHELRVLRNNAVHGKVSDESVSYFEAIKYYELAIKVTMILKNIKK
ncbi:DUF4145 domain-containing protein [Peribacillus sp. NPDC046944]|uniref:DUF4145 domain-containing protein n=1 Tax=unclassified Peribacillus TaxID=2675266 RepID=UPI003D00EDF4